MAATERSDVVFELKEFGDGTPWLMVNFDIRGLSCIKGNDFLVSEARFWPTSGLPTTHSDSRHNPRIASNWITMDGKPAQHCSRGPRDD
jgi:hypothetical protein